MKVMKELGRYLTRPIIPFCFGVPLLLPATLLTVIAFLQDHISTTLHVLGIFFLTISILSIACGMVLGFHDVCRQKPKRPTTKGFQRVQRGILKNKRRRSRNAVSPDLFNSSPSSQNSSRRSSFSLGSGIHVVITNEKARMIPRKKSHKHRHFKNKKILSNNQTPLPSLQEEDHQNALDNLEDGQNGGIRATQSAKNIMRLEKQLREIGLGGHTSRLRDPPDVETLQRSKTLTMDTAEIQRTTLQAGYHSRSKSFPEQDLQRIMAKPSEEPVVSGSVLQEDMLRRSAREARWKQESDHQMPVLTGESHERTGVRINVGSTVL